MFFLFQAALPLYKITQQKNVLGSSEFDELVVTVPALHYLKGSAKYVTLVHKVVKELQFKGKVCVQENPWRFVHSQHEEIVGFLYANLLLPIILPTYPHTRCTSSRSRWRRSFRSTM